METKKENLPILEQVIGVLEKKAKKEIFMKKIGMIVYVILLLAWSWYFGNLFYRSFLGKESEILLHIWVQNSFQIALFLSAIVLFGSYLRNKIAIKKKEKLISAIKTLKFFIKKGVPPIAEIIFGENFGTIKIYFDEWIRMSRIMDILSQKNDDLIIFREEVHKEISSLSEEQKEKILIKIYELEDFFTYL